MPFPTPKPGLVIRYAFLWRNDAAQGREEGAKDRPCAIVLTSLTRDGETMVTVVPVTHAQPPHPSLAVEMPASVKRRLGLDNDRSWIVVTDANRFKWPGPDLRPQSSGDMSSVAFGELPAWLFKAVRDTLADAIEARLVGVVTRSR